MKAQFQKLLFVFPLALVTGCGLGAKITSSDEAETTQQSSAQSGSAGATTLAQSGGNVTMAYLLGGGGSIASQGINLDSNSIATCVRSIGGNTTNGTRISDPNSVQSLRGKLMATSPKSWLATYNANVGSSDPLVETVTIQANGTSYSSKRVYGATNAPTDLADLLSEAHDLLSRCSF